ncbi:MAG: helix-turn-helix transcriptional regulator [Lachnospiraceae bacterium]|nr:helix-turn-helix transcriptional regulator [Lachnospiraceae bacterium]
MNYPVIDPVGTGMNMKSLIKNSGNTVAGVVRLLGLADRSTMYKWLRGEALPGIDNLLALSNLLGVSINDILVTR